MDKIGFFRDLAVIFLCAKVMGLAAQKLKAPQVVGEIIAGLLIGPSVFGWVSQSDFLSMMAEIGVILLMFGAGIETNMRDLLKTGPKALLSEHASTARSIWTMTGAAATAGMI